MFIIPVTGNISTRNPPLITISLIFINCIVYFLFQLNDHENYSRAYEFYDESGLAKIELSYYVDYLRAGRKGMASLPDADTMDDGQRFRFYEKMQQDRAFQAKLDREEIITPQDEQYDSWKDLRSEYEKMLSQVVAYTHGFIPAQRKPSTFLTHMFLHGSFSHLLGNMIFLWIVGCILEMGCGRIWYPIIYLIGGLAAVTLIMLIYIKSTVPLVGASGAIAALMGGFTVLYGRKKVKIFYSLGFYFGYMKMYGLILLPAWVGNELFQLFLGGESNIAYVAHIGGLLGGALLGFICLKTSDICVQDLVKEEPVNEDALLLEQAVSKMTKLDFQAARELFEQVLAKDPLNADALKHLFNTDKQQPENPRFHATAERLLSFLSRTKTTHELACETYIEYAGLAKQPRLSPKLYLSLASAFAESGHLEKSVPIFADLLKQKPDLPGLPMGLLKLADALSQKGQADRVAFFLQAICKSYPNTSAAEFAEKALKAKR